MGTYEYYNSHRSNLNNVDASYSDIKGYFTGQTNPVEATFTPQKIDVTKPTLRSATGLAESLGISKTYYDGDTILSNLNEQTTQAYTQQQKQLTSGMAKTQREYDNIQDNRTQLTDSLFGQNTQLGIAKNMVATNKLSTILGTSQQLQDQMNREVDAQINAYSTFQSALGKNQVTAMDTANKNLMTLADMAETLYQKDVLQYNAELQYNKEVEQSYANWLAAKQVADTNYDASLSYLAAEVYNNNQNASTKVSLAAQLAAAQDRASQKLIEAGKIAADAIINKQTVTVLKGFSIGDYNSAIENGGTGDYLQFLASLQARA